MIDRRAYYEKVMSDFNKRYGLTEQEFLRLYNLQDEERQKEEQKLPKGLKEALIHLKVAYGLMLKQQKGESGCVKIGQNFLKEENKH